MDYDDAVAAMFGPRPDGTAVPEVVAAPSPARRLRDAAEPVAMHAVWGQRTNERLAALGLDFLEAYVAGRAASLGEPVAAVVAATFAWFEPGLVTGVYGAARSVVDRDQLLGVRDEATTASLRAILGDADPTWVADRLADAAEQADGTGRPLFSGLRSRGRPTDPVQRLWWACDMIREHRGDSHVAVVAVEGPGPVEMNVLTELWLGMPLLSYSGTRGWSPEQLSAAVDHLTSRGWVEDGRLTSAGAAARSDIEARTDAAEQSIVDALGRDLDRICRALHSWGERCIEAQAFPADILKRAAG